MRTLAGLCLALAAHTALNAVLLRRPGAAGSSVPEGAVPVSVLVPARDEAASIQACLASVLAQTHRCEVLVLDDGSTDGTADLARELGVRVLPGRPLPPGWLGKPYACSQLARAATGQVLVFLDADVRLAPTAIADTLGLLESTGLDLLSPYPRQQAPGLTRLIQPLLQWSWLTFVPLRLNTVRALAVANGQLLAVRRAVYERAGGHGAVRDQVVEDIALLRAVQRTGGRGGVVDGTRLATCRMYGSWPELSAGYRKSLHTVPLPALAVLAGLYVLPPAAALRGSRAGTVAMAAGVASRAVAARRTGSPVVDSLAHPVSVTLLLWLAARSRLDNRRHRLTWKGRPV